MAFSPLKLTNINIPSNIPHKCHRH